MTLPIPVDYAAMEAKLVSELPAGKQWQYEPKWDGFRCLAFKDSDDVALRSKAGQPLERYFPEIVEAIAALRVEQCVLDGELVVPQGDGLSFDELLMRIHPAASRVTKLSREHPALYVVFDLLVDDRGGLLIAKALTERRVALEHFFTRHLKNAPRFRLSRVTTSRADVDAWFASLGSGLDGVVAKRVDLPYQSGERKGMQKFKHMRTADCVVGGFRYGTKTEVVGSLLLGLFDDGGLLHHVGFSSNIAASERASVTRKLEALRGGEGFTGRAPGGPSRWSSERSGEWVPLKTKLVVEVQYDHFSGDRFRHGTKFLRWRPDKAPAQCTLAQVQQESVATLALL
ncbi:MAG TPA: ATP-dependent DNA ligase [Casimicrobiaceae bacterium]|nr:ATP-dependent DNA ligase [Casimicrobiaceae bacterium]